MERHVLSKSTYIRGLQCHKSLFLNKFHKDLRDEISDEQQRIFSRGSSVGELAQQLFPDGKDASPENYYDFKPAIAQTNQWIDQGQEVIYEAAFQFEGVLAALDILVHREGKFYAYEVKSSTEVKDYHLNDASLQYYVMKGCGIKVEDFSIVYINNQYVRAGDIDVHQLFTIESVLEQATDLQLNVAKSIASMKETLEGGVVPEIDIGPHCSDPFSCDFSGHCWAGIPEDSVFDLVRSGKKSWNFYNRGILELSDIPEGEELSDTQQIQVDGIKFGHEVFDKAKVEEFLNKWKFPLYFLDFETIFPGVPLYNKSRPYQQVPFQYSLHVLYEDGRLDHHEFLHETDGSDPREPMMNRLIKELGTKGNIVAYNASFEIGCMQGIAELFPRFQEDVALITDRVVDLLIPFRSRWVYKPAMKKSASIKYVLPALVPELSYKDLEIQEGGTASSTFESMVRGEDVPDQDKVRKDLLEYCKLDTLAMVEIYKYLKERVDE
ncbi:MAG: DUF2779 domain-containing protein [Vicingaceae bacterium]